MYKKTLLTVGLVVVNFFSFTQDRKNSFTPKQAHDQTVTEFKRQTEVYNASKRPRGEQPVQFVNKNGNLVTVTVSSGPDSGVTGSLKDFFNDVSNNKMKSTTKLAILVLACIGANHILDALIK